MCSNIYVPYLREWLQHSEHYCLEVVIKYIVFKYLCALLEELLLHSEHNCLGVKLLGM